MHTNIPEPEVHIIDDDEAVLDSLDIYLRAIGLTTRVWCNPQKFLDEYGPQWRGCLILDIRMPAISGLGLQKKLAAIGSTLPIIFMTGHGDVSTAVQAMKAGAFEFIEKPIEHEILREYIRRAFELDSRTRQAAQRQQQIRERLETLTPRETEVLDYVLDGKATKVIALELGLSQRTVDVYRANIMQKIQSKSVVQLVKMLSEFRAASQAQ